MGIGLLAMVSNCLYSIETAIVNGVKGSAVKVAGMHNVDNRIMYRAGVLARELGQIDADFVMGVPLSATGKSIYFDR